MRETLPRLMAAVVGIVCLVAGIWQLERARSGLAIEEHRVGTTPVTVYQRTGNTAAPAVVIAHGFAGSRQLMEAYALTLARAGYVAVAFDFQGHGRNPTPMSGDVTRIDGTTRVLMGEVERVVDFALTLPGVDGRIALLGHSMASDIIVRQALQDRRIAATVAISMFSEAVTATAPQNLLMISGEWETMLRADALRNVHLAGPSATEGETVGDPTRMTGRRAVVAPNVEHVGVLYSATAEREARDWLDAVFGRQSSTDVARTGGPIILMLVGIVVLAWPLAGLMPRSGREPAQLPLRLFLLGVLVPAIVTPVALSFFDTRFLPVLVTDYLSVHLFVYGALSLAILYWGDIRLGPFAWLSGLALAAYGIVVFGGALDRYVANFTPDATRLSLIAVIAIGTVLYMLADSVVTETGRAPLWRVVFARFAFLLSLGIAVAFDFERLFFLLIIIPVIVLFFVIFGLMGAWVGRRTGSPLATGVGLGLILAWSLGVSFPLFVAG